MRCSKGLTVWYRDPVSAILNDITTFLRLREKTVAAQIVAGVDDLNAIHALLKTAGVDPNFTVEVTSKSEPDRPNTDTRDLDSSADMSDTDPTSDDGRIPRRRRLGRYGRPVRATVLDVLESENRSWSSAEVQEAVLGEVGPDRADEKLQATVRTALWTLGKHKNSVRRDGRHLATKWLTDPDTPAVTGVSGTAPTSGLGGDDYEAQQDHRHNPPGRDGDNHGRAPIAGG